MKLNQKQRTFCEEYLIDLNATQAAKRAGYSEKTAKDMGCQNLAKPNIREYIQQLMNKRSERTDITADKVLGELANIAFDDIKNYLSFRNDKVENDLGFEEDRVVVAIKDSETIDTRNVSEISVGKDGQFKFKLYCKDNALVQLGKHLKLFTDKVEHSGEIKTDNPLSNLTTEELKKLAKDG
jgi:phage terminase small subunit